MTNEPPLSPKIRFRNYTPIDPYLNKFNYNTQLPPIPTNLLSSSLSSAKIDMALLMKDNKTIVQQSSLKRNDDLKRRIQSNLKLLEKKTNKALCELVKEKLQRQAEEKEELEMRNINKIELSSVTREDINNILKNKNINKEHDSDIQDHGIEEGSTKYTIPNEKNKKMLDENEIELE